MYPIYIYLPILELIGRGHAFRCELSAFLENAGAAIANGQGDIWSNLLWGEFVLSFLYCTMLF